MKGKSPGRGRSVKKNSQSTVGALSPAVEENLRDEFEALIGRMQSPDHRDAVRAVHEMTGKEVQEFFRTSPRHREDLRSSSKDIPPRPPALIPLSRADELSYPCVVLCSLNYFATGEGHLLGLLIVQVSSASHLREEVSRAWDDYYSTCIEIRPWDDLSSEGALLPIEPAKTVLTKGVLRPAALKYLTTLHVRYA